MPLLADREFRRQLFFFLGIGLFLHLVTAIFSVGFFSWDEHFQTLEFLSPRLGRGTYADLPWEYSQAVRPWFQPMIYYWVIQTLRFFGVENAAIWAGTLRVLSGVMSWFALAALGLCSYRWIGSPSLRRSALAMTGLLCFLPFLDVRTSSENLSAAAFFIGLASFFLVSGPVRRTVIAGILMGLAVQFRYQSVFMVTGFLGYLFFSKRGGERNGDLNRRAAFGIGALILLVAALGVVVDSWGYGRWTFVPWNYFRVNLIEGKANWFSRDPIWFYVAKYPELMPPIGALGFLGVVLGWIKRPKHVLTWVTLPSFALHCLLPHKEVRFLFPLAPAAPLLIAFGLEAVSEAKIRRAWRHLKWILIPANAVLLLVFAFKPAYSPFLLYGFIARNPEIHQIVYRDENPFVQIRALQTNFYRPASLELARVATYQELNARLLLSKQFWLFEGSPSLPPEAGELRKSCQLRFSAFPDWLNALDFIPGIRYANRRSLFFCSV